MDAKEKNSIGMDESRVRLSKPIGLVRPSTANKELRS
jgi:hypothetical protein